MEDNMKEQFCPKCNKVVSTHEEDVAVVEDIGRTAVVCDECGDELNTDYDFDMAYEIERDRRIFEDE